MLVCVHIVTDHFHKVFGVGRSGMGMAHEGVLACFWDFEECSKKYIPLVSRHGARPSTVDQSIKLSCNYHQLDLNYSVALGAVGGQPSRPRVHE